MAFTHGYSGYKNNKCKCTICKAGIAKYQLDAKRERAKERFEIDGRLVSYHKKAIHGRATTYTNYMCRCIPCTDAATEKRLARKRDKEK